MTTNSMTLSTDGPLADGPTDPDEGGHAGCDGTHEQCENCERDICVDGTCDLPKATEVLLHGATMIDPEEYGGCCTACYNPEDWDEGPEDWDE